MKNKMIIFVFGTSGILAILLVLLRNRSRTWRTKRKKSIYKLISLEVLSHSWRKGLLLFKNNEQYESKLLAKLHNANQARAKNPSYNDGKLANKETFRPIPSPGKVWLEEIPINNEMKTERGERNES